MSGNALSLFQAEELELLVRGSLEPLDSEQIQLSTGYEDGFDRDHLTIKLFWQYFESLEPSRQRKLLAFVTGKLHYLLTFHQILIGHPGSDRVPATGLQ